MQKTLDLLVYCLISQKSINDACIYICQIALEIFLRVQCGLCQVFSTQNCPLVMIEKLKISMDNEKAFGVLVTDRSKAFNCFSHNLIIAKLNTNGFILSASKLIHNYHSCRKQITKVNTTYSS